MMGGFFRKVDIQLVVPALVLIAISLTTLFSIDIGYFRNQFLFVILSGIIFFFFIHVDFSFLEELQKPIYIISLIGLTILLFLGFEARGAARWLDVFGLRLQFSEVFKPFLAVALSGFLAKRGKTFSTAGLLLLLLSPLVFLIYKQPDLGSALMYLLSVVMTLFIVGFPLWWFAVSFAGCIIIAPVVFYILDENERERLAQFLH